MADLVSKRELNRATLARQGLLERESTTPAKLAQRLCGLQAQEALPPLIGLWTRLRGVDREGLERLVADGKLVRAPQNLRVNPTFLVDGFVAGVWKSERKGKAATLRLEPFAKVTKRHRAELEEEGDALLRFLEPDASALAVT